MHPDSEACHCPTAQESGESFDQVIFCLLPFPLRLPPNFIFFLIPPLLHLYNQAASPLSIPQCPPPSLFVRPWWRRRWFTPPKGSRVTFCRGPSRVWLCPLLPRPPPGRDGRGSHCPSQSDRPRFSLQPWRDRPWRLAPPLSRPAWGDVRDGGSAAGPGRSGASQRRGWEGGCPSRRSGRRRRCSRSCSVSGGKCGLADEVFTRSACTRSLTVWVGVFVYTL